MIRYLFRKFARLEIIAAVATFLSLALSALPAFTANVGLPARNILLGAAGASLVWLLFAVSRRAFVIVGYLDVMSFLELLATNTRYKLWTARMHVGAGVGEEEYFRIISERLGSATRPIEDFRRLIRIAPAAHPHLQHLVQEFFYRDFAEVRYFSGPGPHFDFMIADDVAVIGFPMAGGSNNVGAVVLRRSTVVQAVADVFADLWEDPGTRVLFRGSRAQSEPDRVALMAKLTALLSTPSA